MGRLEPTQLVDAYCQGFFPMAEPEDDTIYWYAPDPRTIIPLDGFHTPKRVARLLRQAHFDIRINNNFLGVMQGCAEAKPGREETWLSPELMVVYTQLHQLGLAHSLETYQQGKLVGGIYGVALNGFFAGESMFSRVSNASTTALVALLRYLQAMDYQLFDVQYTTAHLLRFGACEISRLHYQQKLSQALQHQPRLEAWQHPYPNTLLNL